MYQENMNALHISITGILQVENSCLLPNFLVDERNQVKAKQWNYNIHNYRHFNGKFIA